MGSARDVAAGCGRRPGHGNRATPGHRGPGVGTERLCVGPVGRPAYSVAFFAAGFFAGAFSAAASAPPWRPPASSPGPSRRRPSAPPWRPPASSPGPSRRRPSAPPWPPRAWWRSSGPPCPRSSWWPQQLRGRLPRRRLRRGGRLRGRLHCGRLPRRGLIGRRRPGAGGVGAARPGERGPGLAGGRLGTLRLLGPAGGDAGLGGLHRSGLAGCLRDASGGQDGLRRRAPRSPSGRGGTSGGLRRSDGSRRPWPPCPGRSSPRPGPSSGHPRGCRWRPSGSS